MKRDDHLPRQLLCDLRMEGSCLRREVKSPRSRHQLSQMFLLGPTSNAREKAVPMNKSSDMTVLARLTERGV
jgi:hypothetical protein